MISLMKYFIPIIVTFYVMSIDPSMSKLTNKRHRSVDRDENKNDDDEKTCVSGYCIDPTYNKLELPPSMPSNVRMNLEVIVFKLFS